MSIANPDITPRIRWGLPSQTDRYRQSDRYLADLALAGDEAELAQALATLADERATLRSFIRSLSDLLAQAIVQIRKLNAEIDRLRQKDRAAA